MSKGRASESTSNVAPDGERREAPQRPGSLTRELEVVEALNLEFYDAFHQLDIEKMARLWSQSPYARCVHPGWEPVVGWRFIRQSWIEIFQSMEGITFTLEDVHVEVTGSISWVNLIAHAEVRTEDEEPFHTAVVSTTLFERTEGDWKIVLHHSSHFVDDDELEEDELDITGGFGTPSSSDDDKPN